MMVSKFALGACNVAVHHHASAVTESLAMSRHLANLQGLFVKLEARYGAEDETVREVGQRLRALEGLEAKGKALRDRRRKAKAKITGLNMRDGSAPAEAH